MSNPDRILWQPAAWLTMPTDMYASRQFWLFADANRYTISPTGRWRDNRNPLRSNTSMATRARTLKAQHPFTDTAPELPTVPKTLADVTTGEEAQAWFEDRVVRSVRASGYCNEALKIMDATFGKPLDTVGVYDTRGSYGSGDGSKRVGHLFPAYLDSDGVDCWYNVWRDKDGRDRNGFDADGRDKDGFNKDGRDLQGFDRDGKDANGIHKDDPDRYIYDSDGYTRGAYNANGRDKFGLDKDGKDERGRDRAAEFYPFDSLGYDRDGYTRAGNKADGTYSADVYEKYYRLRRRF